MNFEKCIFIILEDNYVVYSFSFEFRLRVSLADNGYLTMISRIRNINCKPFSFSFAYRIYLSVSDIRYRIFIVDKSSISLTNIFYESHKYFLHLQCLFLSMSWLYEFLKFWRSECPQGVKLLKFTHLIDYMYNFSLTFLYPVLSMSQFFFSTSYCRNKNFYLNKKKKKRLWAIM
jgi:hypothetical protein